MIFLFIFLIFIGLVVFLKRKYNNPFKMIFVFGLPGSGKSCYLVHEIKKHLKKGWTVYTDLPCNIDGVRLISANDLVSFKPVANSLICLDEVGLTWSNRDYKNLSKGIIEYIKLHRHFKCKMILCSQAFDVDLKVRQCVDQMILQTNLFNCISISRPIVRSITLTEPTAEAESRIADKLAFDKIWRWRFYWMPTYFKYFDSHSVPDRDDIPFTECSSSLIEDNRKAKKALRLLSRHK